MSEENKEASFDAAKALNEIRQLQDDNSAETKGKIEKLEKELTDKFEASQKDFLDEQAERKKLESVVDAVKKDYDELYKKSTRLGSGSEDKLANSQYHKELAKYIRKGVTPSSEAIEEIANLYVEKALDDTDTRAIENAKYQMIDEQGDSQGKGFYMLNELKTMRTQNNPDGGYLTQPDRRTDVSVSREFETSPMRSVANIITTGTNEVEIPIDDNESTSGGWVGEEGTISNTDQAKVGLLKIAVHEQYAQPLVTQKMLDDSYVNVEEWLSNKTNDILTRTENTAFVTGNGSQKPKGIMSYDAWSVNGTYERGKIEQINSGTSATITADGLITLQNSLKETYQARSVFMMKRSSFGAISKLKDGTGAYLLNPMGIPQGFTMTLLGKPVIFADDIAATAADSLSVAYGDFSVGYTIVDRMGIRVLRDEYTSKPYVKFYTTKRVGGAVTNYEAYKILKLAA